jgi:hypothetical protein
MKHIFVFFLSFTTAFSYSQTINLRKVGMLPTQLVETSGLAISHSNLLWSQNDGGSMPTLYGFDTLGNLVRNISITNATNNDWEDLAQDATGNIYIGDFGNNNNTRTDLRIYKIPNPTSFTADGITAAVINFKYPDQKGFPPTEAQKNFDAEAMIFFNDSLFIFSKNQTNPFNGYTKLYRIPSTPGSYTAALIDSFYTETDGFSGQITGADISPDKKKLVLISYGKLYCFSGFTGSAFFKGQLTQLSFPVSQTEAICFIDNCRVFVTDEEVQALGIGRNLYTTDICPLTTGIDKWLLNPGIRLGKPFPNPASGQILIPFQFPQGIVQGELTISNLQGKEIKHITVKLPANLVTIPLNGIPAVTYFCHLRTATGISNSRKIVISR